jgi:hypothetical protein
MPSNLLHPTNNAPFQFLPWSQSYDFDLKVNFYNATGGLARFENKNIFFLFEKASYNAAL